MLLFRSVAQAVHFIYINEAVRLGKFGEGVMTTQRILYALESTT